MKQAQIDYRKRIGRTIALSRCSGQMLKDGEFFDVYEELAGSLHSREGHAQATTRTRR